LFGSLPVFQVTAGQVHHQVLTCDGLDGFREAFFRPCVGMVSVQDGVEGAFGHSLGVLGLEVQ